MRDGKGVTHWLSALEPVAAMPTTAFGSAPLAANLTDIATAIVAVLHKRKSGDAALPHVTAHELGTAALCLLLIGQTVGQ